MKITTTWKYDVQSLESKINRSIKCKMPKSPRFIELRNTQVNQEVVLIKLLNKEFNISLRMPSKKAVVFGQMFIIDSLWNESIKIDVKGFIKKRGFDRMNYDIRQGITPKTAHRRKQTNFLVETINFLVDTLREYGYFIECSQTIGKKTTLKGDIIKRIFKDGLLLFETKTIESKGPEISKIINEKRGGQNSFTIPINDHFLQNEC